MFKVRSPRDASCAGCLALTELVRTESHAARAPDQEWPERMVEEAAITCTSFAR